MYIFSSFIEDLIRNISGPLGIRLRRWYYSGKFEACGPNLVVDTGVHFVNSKDIHLGSNVWIDKNCILIAGKAQGNKNVRKFREGEASITEGKIQIGDSSHIGISTVIQGHGGVKIGNLFTSSTGVTIYSLSNDPSKSKQGTLPGSEAYYLLTPVVIGENVWLGLHCDVIGGLIHDNVFIKAHSIVQSEVEENSISGGQPAKFIKIRFNH